MTRGRHPMPLIRCRGTGGWSRGAPTTSLARERVRRIVEGLPADVAQRVRDVVVHQNRRQWLALRRSGSGAWQVSVHWRLLSCPEVLQTALVDYARSARFPLALQEAIDRLAAEHCEPPRQVSLPQLEASGRHVDLARSLDAAIALLPADAAIPELTIGWSRPSRRARRSLRLGRADVAHGRILIHPVLDTPTFPEYVVDFVVYHEVCHFAAPPLTAAEARARRQHRIHHHAFYAMESRFPQRTDAEQWIAEHLPDLLRAAASRFSSPSSPAR